jgi:hypothetical protein
MKIEIGRFSDKRLKMVKKYSLGDSNVRRNGNEVGIVPKLDEVELERDVLEAVNLWNLMCMSPELRKEINHVLKRHFSKREI